MVNLILTSRKPKTKMENESKWNCMAKNFKAIIIKNSKQREMRTETIFATNHMPRNSFLRFYFAYTCAM